jgi:hypothetical protein
LAAAEPSCNFKYPDEKLLSMNHSQSPQREQTEMEYPQPEDPEFVLAFDRDETVSVNPPRDKDAVPLEWVQVLRRESNCSVYATGYQKLKDEAGIPGIQELVDEHPTAEVTPIDGDAQANGYHPTRRERLEILAELYPDAELVVVDDVDLTDVGGWTHYFPWDFAAAIRSGDLELPGLDQNP